MNTDTRKIQGDEAKCHVSDRETRGKSREKIQPPLTPMIDVTFQLLLFFLLTMSFREAEGQILGKLPDMGGGMESPPGLIDTRIDLAVKPAGNGAAYEVGNVTINNDPKELSQMLVALSRTYDIEKTTVVIGPSADVKWEYVLDAYNQAVKAKLQKVNFKPLD